MAKASDNVFPKLLLSEGAAPSTPAAGVHGLFVDTADDKLKRIDSAGTVTQVEGGGGSSATFSAYTPVLTGSSSNPTLGTGSTASGRYSQVGKLVSARAMVQFGTSGVGAGSGNFYVSLPVNAKASFTDECLGSGYVFDSSALQARVVAVYRVGADKVQLLLDGAATVQNSSPWAWSASDSIVLNLNYEAV